MAACIFTGLGAEPTWEFCKVALSISRFSSGAPEFYGHAWEWPGADEISGFVGPLKAVTYGVPGFNFHTEPDTLDFSAIDGC